MNESILKIETKAGEMVRVGNLQLVPFTQVLRVNIPGINSGLIWNRPTAIWATSTDGSEIILKIVDKTRLSVIRMLFAGIMGSFLIWLLMRQPD